jgi:hypothetical protein
MASQFRLQNRKCSHRLAQLSEQAKTLPRIQHRLAHTVYSQRQTKTFSSQGCTRVFSESNTDFSALRHELGYSFRYRVNHTAQSSVRNQQSGGMGMDPPHGSPWRLYLHAPGLTLVTLGTACFPSVRLPPSTWEFTCLPKGLRIKQKCTCLFEIIIKYYSRPKPPRLSP